MKQELHQRLVWGGILGAITISILALGSPYVEVALIFLSWRLSYEWLHFKAYGTKRQNYTAVAGLSAALTCVFITECLGGTWRSLPVFVGLCVLLFIAAPGKYRNWSVLGFVYISLPILAAGWVITHFQQGSLFLLWVCVIVTLTDSTAYFVGRALKGKKLMPRVSPNKTWSGFWGGMAGGVAGGLMGLIFCSKCSGGMMASFGAAVALAAIAGDLFESYIKRLHGVKDAAPLIPGHGGALDRVDAYLLAIPVAVAIIRVFPGQFPFVLLP